MGFSAEFPSEGKLFGGNEAVECGTRGWNFRTNTEAHTGYFFKHILITVTLLIFEGIKFCGIITSDCFVAF